MRICRALLGARCHRPALLRYRIVYRVARPWIDCCVLCLVVVRRECDAMGWGVETGDFWVRDDVVDIGA